VPPPNEAAPGRIASRVVRSTTANFGGQAVALLVWLALTPFLLHQLGATDYGLWVLATSLAAYGGLLDLGVGAAVTKYVAELRARGESGEASSLIATSLRLYVVLGGLVLVLAVPAALLLGALVDVDSDREAVVRWVVVLAAAGVARTPCSGGSSATT
jgi:O-antigen/teichoic acid export membrane protein